MTTFFSAATAGQPVPTSVASAAIPPGTQHPVDPVLAQQAIIIDGDDQQPVNPLSSPPPSQQQEGVINLSDTQDPPHAPPPQPIRAVDDMAQADPGLAQDIAEPPLQQQPPQQQQSHQPVLPPRKRASGGYQDKYAHMFTWGKEVANGMVQCMECSTDGKPCLLVGRTDTLRKHQEGQPVSAAAAKLIRAAARAKVFAAAGLEVVGTGQEAKRKIAGLASDVAELLALKEAKAAAVLRGYLSDHQEGINLRAKFVARVPEPAQPSVADLWDTDVVRSMLLKTVQMKCLLYLFWSGRPMLAYEAMEELLKALPFAAGMLPNTHWSYTAGWALVTAIDQVRIVSSAVQIFCHSTLK